MLPLPFDEMPSDHHPDFARHRSLCPRTWAVFSRFPEIVTGGFSRLRGMRSPRDQIECGVGVDHGIDHRQQHESANLGDRPRDVLLVDFRASPAELAALAAWRQQSAAAGG